MYTVAEKEAIAYALNIIESKRMGVTLNSAAAAADHIMLKLAAFEKEVFHVTFLTSQNTVIADEIMFTGTINSAPVFPREIAKRALQLNAAAVILAHNHPSGVAEPSSADKSITNLICDALNVLDVRVLDHFIVGNGSYSFAEHGLL